MKREVLLFLAEKQKVIKGYKMSVGLYDMDMATYTLVPFNLELMKLSAYYKKKREVVILSPIFTPERH